MVYHVTSNSSTRILRKIAKHIISCLVNSPKTFDPILHFAKKVPISFGLLELVHAAHIYLLAYVRARSNCGVRNKYDAVV